MTDIWQCSVNKIFLIILKSALNKKHFQNETKGKLIWILNQATKSRALGMFKRRFAVALTQFPRSEEKGTFFSSWMTLINWFEFTKSSFLEMDYIVMSAKAPPEFKYPLLEDIKPNFFWQKVKKRVMYRISSKISTRENKHHTRK